MLMFRLWANRQQENVRDKNENQGKFLLLATLIVSMACMAAEETQELASREVRGTIKEVSINVRRLTIELRVASWFRPFRRLLGTTSAHGHLVTGPLLQR